MSTNYNILLKSEKKLNSHLTFLKQNNFSLIFFMFMKYIKNYEETLKNILVKMKI